MAIGPLRDANLPLGSIRELTETEVEKLRRATSRLKKPATSTAKKAPAPKPAVKRAFPPPGTQKVDRSRPWRKEKPKGEVKVAPAADRSTGESAALPSRRGAAKARPASRKPAKKTYGPPARKASGKPSGKPARKASGKASSKKTGGKPSSRPGGRPSGPKKARKPGGGSSRAGRRGR